MTTSQKIQMLKNYREALVYAAGYETKEEKEDKLGEKKEKQKVLVLTKKWYGKDMKVC